MSKLPEQQPVEEIAVSELIQEEGLEHLFDLLTSREQQVVELLAERQRDLPPTMVIVEEFGVTEERAHAMMQRIRKKARNIARTHGLELGTW